MTEQGHCESAVQQRILRGIALAVTLSFGLVPGGTEFEEVGLVPAKEKPLPQAPSAGRDDPAEGNGPFDVVRLSLVALASLVSFLGVWRSLFPFDLVAIAAALIGGYPVYQETFRTLRRRRVNMEASMALAIAASLVVGQFTASAVITFFVLLSRYIEAYAVDRGRATVIALERSAPKKALIRRDGTEVEVDPQSLEVGDVVIVREGERIPIDGTVVRGSAFVNQAAITGESARVEKEVGDDVYAGAVDESGWVEVRTERVGRDTVFGKIIRLVEEAEGRKAPIQRISDRLAAWLVEFAIGFSAITFLLTRNMTSTISVIVVAGACGVAAGTPLAIVAAMGKAAKKGVVVKGGGYIEEMSRIDTVVLDKTGTLTFGEPMVASVEGFDGCSPRQLLERAAFAERRSAHPLARAIVRAAVESGGPSPDASDSSATFQIPGQGVVSEQGGEEVLVGNLGLLLERGIPFPQTAKARPDPDELVQGTTTAFVAHGGHLCGGIALADRVRKESKAAIADLRRLGIRTVMLTGDNEAVARSVAREIGVDEVHAGLLPQDKVSIVERLVAHGHAVAMVGDGINDAPALARAGVGIGMGAGTDIAIEEADIVLMTNDLQKIADMVKLSKRAYGTIMQNFYGTVGIDGIGTALAFLGILNPLSAAGIHVVSELIFILNSAKIIR